MVKKLVDKFDFEDKQKKSKYSKAVNASNDSHRRLAFKALGNGQKRTAEYHQQVMSAQSKSNKVLSKSERKKYFKSFGPIKGVSFLQ